jgi:hypothetical protein
MLLFQKRFHPGLVSGAVTLTFRGWEKPHVRAGGRYRCHPIGVLEVDRVDRVRVADITSKEARRSGFDSRDELVAFLATTQGGALAEDAEVFRVEFHHGGDGDRVAIALEDRLTPADVEEITQRLSRLDAKEAWTTKTLALIGKHPRVVASRLAKMLGRETAPFKADVVKLKRLGLTQSFEVGYEISPRGRAFLAAGQK